jgi:hypothetical protein
MPHDEWTKSLPDGRVAKFVYDEIVEVCSASIKIGQFVRSRSSLKGPLTREEVEALFAHEMQRAKGAP